ncbi:MAG TPA: DNA-binding response regulator, partial [Syntrophomonas wolfei]|nr:DNA-binding response regulator [Syntrophomonas wolfei]
AVLRRNRQMEEKADASSIITVGEFALKSESYEVYYKDKLLELTLKEYELLELLIKNRGRVLKRDYLLQV